MIGEFSKYAVRVNGWTEVTGKAADKLGESFDDVVNRVFALDE